MSSKRQVALFTNDGQIILYELIGDESVTQFQEDAQSLLVDCHTVVVNVPLANSIYSYKVVDGKLIL